MSRRAGYQPKRRNSFQRKRKSVILLAAEGKNKTETLYFKSIPCSDYLIKIAPGNYTDPVNMVQALYKEYEEMDLDVTLGDAAFCLVDSDTDPMKDRQLEIADEKAPDRIHVVVSSPCFEVWYLCHFTGSTRQYASNNDVLKALKQYIPEYRKDMPGLWKIIGDKTETAIRNAKFLQQQCVDKGLKQHTVAFTPSTEVYKIVELVLPKQG